MEDQCFHHCPFLVKNNIIYQIVRKLYHFMDFLIFLCLTMCSVYPRARHIIGRGWTWFVYSGSGDSATYWIGGAHPPTQVPVPKWPESSSLSYVCKHWSYSIGQLCIWKIEQNGAVIWGKITWKREWNTLFVEILAQSLIIQILEI